MNIYYIGGSPCSGKSTVAEILAKQYNLYYFKADDFLEKYTNLGAQRGYEICQKQLSMTFEEIFMRDPFLQCKEELQFYHETFEFLIDDIRKISEQKALITEGAAYLPQLMKTVNIPKQYYFALLPTPQFQISHYEKRTWVPHILKDCKNPKQAFQNWMKRDILFAQSIQRQCIENDYSFLLNDGQLTIDEIVHRVSIHFGI